MSSCSKQSQHATLSQLSCTGALTTLSQIGHTRRDVSTCAATTLLGVMLRDSSSAARSLMVSTISDGVSPSDHPRNFSDALLVLGFESAYTPHTHYHCVPSNQMQAQMVAYVSCS